MREFIAVCPSTDSKSQTQEGEHAGAEKLTKRNAFPAKFFICRFGPFGLAVAELRRNEGEDVHRTLAPRALQQGFTSIDSGGFD